MSTPTPEPAPALTASQLADALGVGLEQVNRLARDRRIPFINVGTGVREDRRYDLDAVKAALTVAPRAGA